MNSIEQIFSYLLTQIPLPYIYGILTAVVCILSALIIKIILNFKQILNQESVFLELTPPAFTDKTAYTTGQLFSVLHSIGRQQSFVDRLLGRKVLFSFEIASTRIDGIRYIVKTTPEQADSIKRTIVSYLPHVRVKQVDEYLLENIDHEKAKIVEFKLRKHFAFPLAKQNVLNQHDPVAYITGMMTKLAPEEIISLQIVASPTLNLETSEISLKILRNEDVLRHLNKSNTHWLLNALVVSINFVFRAFQEIIWSIIDIFTSNPRQERDVRLASALQQQLSTQNLKPARVLSVFEQEVVASIQEKIDQPLFETSIRALVLLNDIHDQKQRIQGIKSSLATFSLPKYQSLYATYHLPLKLINKIKLFVFKHRLLSPFANKSSSLLSVSEIAALYHFPFADVTQTEGLAKVISPELPTPLALKNESHFDVIFGENTYGNSSTPIGVTEDDRSRHFFAIGQTGSGKSTVIFHMAKDDMQKGRGICVVDPHGDLVEDLLNVVPESRIDDVVYLNPFDISNPIRMNLLELTPGLTDDELELEKEIVCENVISIFRRIFMKDETVDAHRIEFILRNAIHTAFYVKGATLFTVTKLLTSTDFRNKVLRDVTNDDLLDFWKDEFNKAGDWQITKMVSGVTAKIGRFSFSPIARRILENPTSTISMDALLDQGKIILCNLSEGKLGEDTAQLLGTTMIAKIQLAILKRARMEKQLREPFYLYVDEFQNFATPYFTKLLSGGRKFGLRVIIAEQSTTQQKDERTVNTILANVGTVLCFKTASPIDEKLFLPQFSPLVSEGQILNLPRHHFYIKLGAKDPVEPFSGVTLPIEIRNDPKKVERIIIASRKNYASVYEKPSNELNAHTKRRKNTSSQWGKAQFSQKSFLNKKKDITSLT